MALVWKTLVVETKARLLQQASSSLGCWLTGRATARSRPECGGVQKPRSLARGGEASVETTGLVRARRQPAAAIQLVWRRAP